MAVLLVHGAGSSGEAARTLLGPLVAERIVIPVEDRSGDVHEVVEALDREARHHRGVTHAVGISLGAHAVALWGARQAVDSPRLVMVLPAWTGVPDSTAKLTGAAADEIRAQGIDASLARIRAESPSPDIVSLLEMAWHGYSTEGLADALQRASRSPAPSATDLARISARACVVGWEGDPLHPAHVARQWASELPRARVALAARPSVDLLQAALGAATGWRARRSLPRGEVT